jgi:hypothetical protein
LAGDLLVKQASCCFPFVEDGVDLGVHIRNGFRMESNAGAVVLDGLFDLAGVDVPLFI